MVMGKSLNEWTTQIEAHSCVNSVIQVATAPFIGGEPIVYHWNPYDDFVFVTWIAETSLTS